MIGHIIELGTGRNKLCRGHRVAHAVQHIALGRFAVRPQSKGTVAADIHRSVQRVAGELTVLQGVVRHLNRQQFAVLGELIIGGSVRAKLFPQAVGQHLGNDPIIRLQRHGGRRDHRRQGEVGIQRGGRLWSAEFPPRRLR